MSALDPLRILKDAARECGACDLYRHATQTVFGEGSLKARIVVVREQPGDSEDHDGRPFVGPAGKLLDKAIEENGISRSDLYVTNAVKHFKTIHSSSILRASPADRATQYRGFVEDWRAIKAWLAKVRHSR